MGKKKGRITEYSTLHLPMKNMPFGRALQKYIKDWVYQTIIYLKSVFVDVILQRCDSIAYFGSISIPRKQPRSINRLFLHVLFKRQSCRFDKFLVNSSLYFSC